MAAFALLAALPLACTDTAVKKVTVTGTVTHNGKPLKGGCMIRFHGPGDAFCSGTVRDDGTYTVTDVVPGDIKVSLMIAPRASGSSDSKGEQTTPHGIGSGSIPPKYMDAQTSGLNFTIKPDTKDLNIDLK